MGGRDRPDQIDVGSVTVSEVRVEVRGIDELNSGMKELAGNIKNAAPREFERVADQVAGQVKGSVPRRTGRLAGSVTAQQLGEGASVGMGAGVPYATYVEYGGRGHPHNPQGTYLYPAAMSAEPQLVAAGERAVENEIRGMSWPSP